MLFIQSIRINYDKSVRYANYANIRNSIKFRPIQIEDMSNLDCKVLFQSILLYQSENGLNEVCNKIIPYNDKIFNYGKKDSFWRFHHIFENMRIIPQQNNFKIIFCEDKFGSIKRRGHNETYFDKSTYFQYTDILNETAFILKSNEYGRITFNNRYVEHDTGKWFYTLHTYNIINCDKSKFREKMFFKKNPDYEYSNLKYLK